MHKEIIERKLLELESVIKSFNNAIMTLEVESKKLLDRVDSLKKSIKEEDKENSNDRD